VNTDGAVSIVDLTGSKDYDPPVTAGQAVYSKRVLRLVYDVLVHGISNPLIWRSPTQRLVRLYDQHVSANHLEVGVGTGYLLDRCHFPTADPAIALADLNPNTLEVASHRIRRYPRQTLYRWNAFAPLSIGRTFDSVGLTYVLHCLPGTMDDKAVVFEHLRKVMAPDAVLFGATLLHNEFLRSYPPAKGLAALYNRKGIFSNQQDSLPGLQSALGRTFSDPQIEVVGCVATFVARCT
jgi:SAM-dependent methyltransferase